MKPIPNIILSVVMALLGAAGVYVGIDRGPDTMGIVLIICGVLIAGLFAYNIIWTIKHRTGKNCGNRATPEKPEE